MLAKKLFSRHSARQVMTRAISENHRKFTGPNPSQYKGIQRARKSVETIFIQRGIFGVVFCMLPLSRGLLQFYKRRKR